MNISSSNYTIKVELNETKYHLQKDRDIFNLELIDTTIKNPKPVGNRGKITRKFEDLEFNGVFDRICIKKKKN